MKNYMILCALALASCTGNEKKIGENEVGDSGKNGTSAASKLNMPAQNMEYCFMRTDGNAGQDTTAVHLVIKGDKVSGHMNWLPKEKDRRAGTLSGHFSGNEIKATWTFMQEGQTEKIAIAFKLSSQQLAQKPLIADPKTGKQQTDDRADYTIIYNLDNCTQFKIR